MPTLGALGGTSNHGFEAPTTGNGLSSTSPGFSALQLKNSFGYTTDGVYYIMVGGISTPVYCIMNPAMAGGGWMMIMKATTGNTFNYAANYWTTNNTLSSSDTTRNNADAKFNTFNYTPGKDLLAVFPDLGTGGSITAPAYGWTWYQPSFGTAAGLPTGSTAITALSLFNSPQPTVNAAGSNIAGTGYFIQDATTFSGFASGVWSSQVDIRFYGFNWNNYYSSTYLITSKARWGFGFNENGEGLFSQSTSSGAAGSNDTGGGIGMQYLNGSIQDQYSAGDAYSCCGVTGVNRSMRVEMYIR